MYVVDIYTLIAFLRLKRRFFTLDIFSPTSSPETSPMSWAWIQFWRSGFVDFFEMCSWKFGPIPADLYTTWTTSIMFSILVKWVIWDLCVFLMNWETGSSTWRFNRFNRTMRSSFKWSTGFFCFLNSLLTSVLENLNWDCWWLKSTTWYISTLSHHLHVSRWCRTWAIRMTLQRKDSRVSPKWICQRFQYLAHGRWWFDDVFKLGSFPRVLFSTLQTYRWKKSGPQSEMIPKPCLPWKPPDVFFIGDLRMDRCSPWRPEPVKPVNRENGVWG